MSDTNNSDRSDPVVLNMTQFEEAAGGDAELMAELAELYITDTEGHLDSLREAVAVREAERLGRVAHGLKGSSASIGADRAAEAFRRLEIMGRTGELEGLDEALELAQDAYRHTRERLRSLAA